MGGDADVAGGLAGLAVAVVGTWWILAYRGPLRALGVLLVLAAPAGVIALYTSEGLWGPALVAVALWGAALGCRPARGRSRDRPAPGGGGVPHRRRWPPPGR
ncbi:hypothetical protein ACFWPV_05150 [Streptomyces uncialis]|uniref:hypothetical protein n=1 Tax=Streptomyces uncialis TaxID=1048205 RepID=UPI003657B85B